MPSEPVQSAEKLPSHWSINGRLSIIQEDENWYSNFIWNQLGNDFYLRFMGPLGQTELELRQSGQTVWLKTPSYERHSGDLEQLLLEETGWRFPLKSMRFWILGKINPDEEAGSVQHHEERIKVIKQSGWLIEYHSFMQVDDYYLPRKIVVSDPRVKIKIIISNWFFESLETNSL